MGRIDRRGFLRAGAGAAALAGIAACSTRGASESRTDEPRALIDPNDAPFDHVVVLTLTGRSFDHLLGWLPAARGRQHGLAYRDVDGMLHDTWDLGVDVEECGGSELAHDWTDGAVHLGDDDNRGFLLTVGEGDLTPLSFFSQRAVPAIGRLATSFTTLGNYFASVNAGSVPNRMYLHAGATDLDDDRDIEGGGNGASDLRTTIWDRLRAADLTGRYYGLAANGQPFVSRFGNRYEDLVRPFRALLTDARTGRLPTVAFAEAPVGPDVRTDQTTITDVFTALRRGPRWERTVLVVHYDQWGGYFDHVPPPKVIDANVNPRPGPHPDYSQLGFRVPCVVASPFSTAAPMVGGTPFEHTSILRMIEWRWGLRELGMRDRNARNLAEVFDFTRSRPTLDRITYRAPADRGCR
jgi:phospholipase C